MKYPILKSFSLWLLLLCGGCGQPYSFSTNDPLEHYRYVDETLDQVGRTILDFAGVAGSAPASCDKLADFHRRTVEDLGAAHEKLRGVEPFPKSEDYAKTAVALVGYHLEYLKGPYQKWVELRCKPDQAQQDYIEMEKIGSAYREGLYAPDDAYQAARARFIADHRLPVLFPHVQDEDYRLLK